MPPKKEGTAKKPAKARTPNLIDGLNREEMSKEQLEDRIALEREELDREREERNYFQLEKEQINDFWKVTVKKLEEVEFELKDVEKAIEDNKGQYQVETKVYKQKMKHLLCEHQNMLSELKASHSVVLEDLQTEGDQLKTEICDQMSAINADIQELGSDNSHRELEQKHNEEMTSVRNNYVVTQQRQQTEAAARYEKMQQDLENLTKSVITERQLEWDNLINKHRDDHKVKDDLNTHAQVNEIEIIIQKINNIKKNKKKYEGNKAKRLEMKKDTEAALQDSQHLSEFISKVKGELAYAKRKTENCSLNVNGRENAKRKALEDLRKDHVALEKKFSELQLERDKLYKSLAQHEADLECVALEKKLQALTDSLGKVQTQLVSVLSAPNLNHAALKGIINKVEGDLEFRNAAIKKLELKRNLIAEARGGMLLAFEQEERALRVPVKQLVL